MLYKKSDVSEWFADNGYDFLSRHFLRTLSCVMVGDVEYLEMFMIQRVWASWCTTNERNLLEESVRKFQAEVIGYIPIERVSTEPTRTLDDIVILERGKK